MLNFYYLIFSYSCYAQYFIGSLLWFFSQVFSFKKKPTGNVSQDYSLKQEVFLRINRLITDNAFFIWLKNKQSFFKKYEKNIIEDPHINIEIKKEDYKVYRQIHKQKYSKVV